MRGPPFKCYYILWYLLLAVTWSKLISLLASAHSAFQHYSPCTSIFPQTWSATMFPAIPINRHPLNPCFSSQFTWGFTKIRGTLFRGPYNKDYSILGSILGFPYFGKLPPWWPVALHLFKCFSPHKDAAIAEDEPGCTTAWTCNIPPAPRL